MGVVYRAYDPTLDREVAIKSVRLDATDEAARSGLEERLAREARAAAKLQHPNIVAVYDFFRIEDRAYIVMEFVRGSMRSPSALLLLTQPTPLGLFIATSSRVTS